MGHHVSGLVATPRALAAVAGARGLGVPIPLCCGLAFLPVDEENIGGLAAGDPEAAPPGFEHLTPAVLAALAEPSVGHALAYIETDHFGGVGGQGAVVCAGGRVAMPPAWGDGPRGPVSRALAHLGVRVVPPHPDEFDTVGLGAFRSNEARRRAHDPR